MKNKNKTLVKIIKCFQYLAIIGGLVVACIALSWLNGTEDYLLSNVEKIDEDNPAILTYAIPGHYDLKLVFKDIVVNIGIVNGLLKILICTFFVLLILQVISDTKAKSK